MGEVCRRLCDKAFVAGRDVAPRRGANLTTTCCDKGRAARNRRAKPRTQRHAGS